MFIQMTPTLFSSTNDFFFLFETENSRLFSEVLETIFYGHLRCYNENATTELYQICDFNCWKDFSFVVIDF